MKHWISGAIKHPGIFSASAKKAGMSTMAYAEKQKKSGGVLGQRARLAITLSRLRKKKKNKYTSALGGP